MRSSLEHIDFIERYLLGEMSEQERVLAEQKIANSPELTELLSIHKVAVKAAQRKALRATVANYVPKSGGGFFNQFGWILVITAIILGIGTSWLAFSGNSDNSNESDTSSNSSDWDRTAAENTRSFKDVSYPGTSSGVAEYQRPDRYHYSGKDEEVQSWIPFKRQEYDFKARDGGVFEGDDGTVVVVPENALIDEKGLPVRGEVQMDLIEAVHWEDMIAYNLSTVNGNKALSSGGMMKVEFSQKGKKLSINPERPLHIEIPTDNYNPDMMVWEGNPKNGSVDWQKPRSLKKYLTKVDLDLLDFIPEGFDDEVAKGLPYHGHTSISDQLVDSLYYSLSKNPDQKNAAEAEGAESEVFVRACEFDIKERTGLGTPRDQPEPYLKGKGKIAGRVVDENGNPIVGMNIRIWMDNYLRNKELVYTDSLGYFSFNKLYSGNGTLYGSLTSIDESEYIWKICFTQDFTLPKRSKKVDLTEPIVAYRTEIPPGLSYDVTPLTGGCYIDPASIKALKAERFGNTFIATKEFEERLQAMHLSAQGETILSVYINNLDKDLWECDQMAANMLSGQDAERFNAFARQKLTTVQNNGIHSKKLLRYFNRKRKEYRAEAQKRQKELEKSSLAQLNRLQKKLSGLRKDEQRLAKEMAGIKHPKLSVNSNGQVSGNYRKYVRRQRSLPRSYQVDWYSSKWMNIDCFLARLAAGAKDVHITLANSRPKTKVYQCIRSLQTLIQLNGQDDRYLAKFPKSNSVEETYCLAISRDENDITFDVKYYNPGGTDQLTLNPKVISRNELYEQICLLSPGASFLATELRQDEGRIGIEKQIRKEREALMSEFEQLKNRVDKETRFRNGLLTFLSKCPMNSNGEPSATISAPVVASSTPQNP